MSIEGLSAGSHRALLTGLYEHPGWRVFCERFDDKLKAMENDHWNVSTPASDAEILRQVRAKLKDEFEPKKLLRDYMVSLDAAIERDRREREKSAAVNKFKEDNP